MNDKYNENDDKEWTFVGICEEIIDDCYVKIYYKEFCASAVASRSIALQENWLADTRATAHITMSDVGMTNVRPVSVTVVSAMARKLNAQSAVTSCSPTEKRP